MPCTIAAGVALLMFAEPTRAVERMDLALGTDAWDREARGAFSIRFDRRGVLTMSHADGPAKAGESASVSRRVDLPKNPKRAVVLRFYLTDDYVGDKQQAVYFRDAVKERVSDWREEVRFAQVLLDDVVAWSQDVLGRNPTTAGGRFYDLDISEFVGKKAEVKLTLRVRDEQDTGGPFATDVFWARLELIWDCGDQPPPVEFPPRLVLRREKLRPTAPPAPPSGKVALTLRNPSGVALSAWPVRWGVPLPQGALTKATQIALTGADGKAMPLEAQVTARWPDGSAKWVLLDLVVPLTKDDAIYELQYGAAVTGASEPSLDAPGSEQLPPQSTFTLVASTGAEEHALKGVRTGEPGPQEKGARSESRAAMAFLNDDGRAVARGELASWSYQGLPVGIYYQRFTLEVGGQKGGLKVRQLAMSIHGMAKTSQIGVDGSVMPAEGRWTLCQEGENALIGTGSVASRQARWDGWVLAESSRQDLAILRWPWQQFPTGCASDEKGFRLLLLDVPPGAPPVALAPGEAKTWEFMAAVAERGLTTDQSVELNAVFQQPPVVVFQPGWIAATGVFGPFLERDDLRFPEYETAASKVISSLTEQRASQHAFGFESFGDTQFGWGFGEALTYWSNTEYDHAHALLWQFLRTGDPELFYRACQAALHYRDVDLIHADDEHPDWVGGAHHHSETHTHHGPNISHHWTEGLFDHWLLTGDTRSLECGQLAADYAKRVALQSTYGGGERDAGWNLIALMGAYRATADGSLLDAARKKVEEVLAYLDPVRGVSSVPIFEQTAYEGGTPFMAGILMRGLTMYYDETRDERVGWAICGLCDWLECEMMPEPGRFCYKETPQQKGAGQPQLLVLDGAALAWSFTGDPVYRDLALNVYREGVGSTNLTNMRDMPHALALLATALPPVAVRRVEHPFLFVVGSGAAPEATFAVANLLGDAQEAEVAVGDSATRAEVAAGGAPAEVKVALPIASGQTGVVRLPYEVKCGEETADRGELVLLALLKQPRFLVLAPEGNLTTRALTLLYLPFVRREVGEFRPELLGGTDVLVCGFDVATAALGPHARAIAEWVKSGGVVLGFRDDAAAAGWLPSPVKQDASYEPGAILKPDGGPLALVHRIDAERLAAVHGGSMYRAFYDLGLGWEPLASAGAKQGWDKTTPASNGPHYGLVELRDGKGRIVLCQLIPEYAWLNDDGARLDSSGRRMLENLVGYACVSAAR